MSKGSEYICPEYRTNFAILEDTFKNPQKYTIENVLEPRRRFLFFGQPGIGKEDQLAVLFKESGIPTIELLVDPSVEQTVTRIQSLALGSSPAVLVIRKCHLLRYMLENTTVRAFALSLRYIGDTFIVGISDEPYSKLVNDEFFDQFDVITPTSLPTQEHIQQWLTDRFDVFLKHCQMHGIDLNCKMSDDDYQWLSYCADYCTPRDVFQFCSRVFNAFLDGSIESIDRATLENTDNGLMFKAGTDNLLSITDREVAKTQQMFDTMSGVGPRLSKRAKKQ